MIALEKDNIETQKLHSLILLYIRSKEKSILLFYLSQFHNAAYFKLTTNFQFPQEIQTKLIPFDLFIDSFIYSIFSVILCK